MVPRIVVEGVGAIEDPAGPPVSKSYHNKSVPVAVKGDGIAFWQSVTGVETIGGFGISVTLIVNSFVIGQFPLGSDDVTEYTVVTKGVAVTVDPIVELRPMPVQL